MPRSVPASSRAAERRSTEKWRAHRCPRPPGWVGWSGLAFHCLHVLVEIPGGIASFGYALGRKAIRPQATDLTYLRILVDDYGPGHPNGASSAALHENFRQPAAVRGSLVPGRPQAIWRVWRCICSNELLRHSLHSACLCACFLITIDLVQVVHGSINRHDSSERDPRNSTR